jgi:hypothetical protein
VANMGMRFNRLWLQNDLLLLGGGLLGKCLSFRSRS